MSLLDIFFIFLILSSLQPIVRQRLIESGRSKLIHQIEDKRGSRVIVLVHRQETLAFLGFPLLRYIDIEDSEAVLRAIRLTDADVPIDIIVHTPGGMVLAAEQIAYALCRHAAKVTVLVPHYAMSGGTLIALAADEIIMDDNAVLGPVDPQVGQYPAASIVAVTRSKPIADIDDETLILADVAKKAIEQVRHTVQSLLEQRCRRPATGKSPEDAQHLAEVLTGGTWTHDYPIRVSEAQALGLPVTTDMPREVYSLMSLYPQSRQRRPSVDYIPVPYPRRDGQPGQKAR
ncbi:MAG: SDH family Clp fold serine proteinase [Anaerolineae bacterium]